jgi:RNA polymerase sigma-70 factor (ECF subfamily)
MLRVRDGETARLGMIFERHHKKLFNFFLRTIGRRQVAEDLTQEVFVRMLKSRQTFRGDRGFGPWMFRVAKNVRADYFDRLGRAPSADAAIEMVEHVDESPTPSDVAEQSESVEMLNAAMERLPAEKRELLVMARFEFLKHDEIASLLDCTVGTVKVRVHRVIKELAQIYHQLANEART